MGERPSRRSKLWLPAGLLLLGAGCGRHDTEALSRIGRKLADRAETWIGEFKERLDLGGGNSVETRVTQRLRWDKALADQPIEVKSRGADIELGGILSDPALKNRAVELAQSTTGVGNVVDNIQLLDINPTPLPKEQAGPDPP
jgi:BON domain